jgi:hypothetical protein
MPRRPAPALFAVLAPLAALLAALLPAARAGAQPAAGAPAADSLRVVSALAWSAAPAVSVPRDHHVTFLVEGRGGSWLHVVGGNDYRRMLADAWRAPIAPDGSVGAWEAAESLPAPHAGHGVAQSARAVVLTGGQTTGLARTPDTFVAAIDADGRLGPWRSAAPLPAPRYHHASAYHRGWVYVTGGIEASVSTPTAWRARLADDGTLGAWEALPDMPRPRSHHTMFVHEGALYLVAGLDGNPAGQNEPLKDVLRAPIRDDGTLGPWQTVSTLPNAYGTHGTAVHGGHLYLFGGVEDNARFVDKVLRAPLLAGGAVGPWERVEAPLPNARAHVHQLPLLRGRVYSLGGSNRRQVTGDVHVGTFR